MGLKLRPMKCKECGTINELQQMLNTANCTQTNCNGYMNYIDESTYVEVEIKE